MPDGPARPGDAGRPVARRLRFEPPDPRSERESSAVRLLRALVSAQGLFLSGDPDRDGPDFGTLRELETARLIVPPLDEGVRNGYRFIVYEVGGSSFKATAQPVELETDGQRFFFVDQSGTIRHATGRPAGPADPGLGD